MSELKAFDITVAEEGYCEGIVKYRRAVYDKSEADKVIAELEEERRWRKCSEEKPGNGQEVLVWLTAGGPYGFVLTSRYIDSQWYYGEDPQGCKPSHWMPLPSAPKEENK
jgi:hypothetical protein